MEEDDERSLKFENSESKRPDDQSPRVSERTAEGTVTIETVEGTVLLLWKQ